MVIITTYFGSMGPSLGNTYVQYYVLPEGGPIGPKPPYTNKKNS